MDISQQVDATGQDAEELKSPSGVARRGTSEQVRARLDRAKAATAAHLQGARAEAEHGAGRAQAQWKTMRADLADEETRPSRPASASRGRRRAAGIYGAIITAALLAAAGARLPTGALVVSVVVTLVVYWLAEEYAELLGEQAEGGFLLSWGYIRGALAASWPMVTASFAPLAALVLARLAGASALAAANIGLAVAVVLLAVHGWAAGRAARLRGWPLFCAASIVAALGLVMVLLKNLSFLHLH